MLKGTITMKTSIKTTKVYNHRKCYKRKNINVTVKKGTVTNRII